MSATTKPIVYRGVKEISDVVGINHKRFGHYVRNLGLPAFKYDAESNVWFATHDDLEVWVERRKKAFFEDRQW